MKLRVCPAEKEDIYKDIARIPQSFRTDKNLNVIKEGKVCKITVGSKSIHVILRGKGNSNERAIFLDEIKREELGVTKGEEVDVQLLPLGVLGTIRWALGTSDIAYRTGAWFAFVSIVVTILGLVFGFFSCKK